MHNNPAQIIYLETCLPCYFGGHRNPYYITAPVGRTYEIKDELINAVRSEELFLPSGESAPEEVYAELELSVRELFKGLDLRHTFHDGIDRAEYEAAVRQGDDMPYAHWGILWGRWQDQ